MIMRAPFNITTRAGTDRTTTTIKFSERQLEMVLLECLAKEGYVPCDGITDQSILHPTCRESATSLVLERKWAKPPDAGEPLIKKE
jgi:hypothetical protein